MGVRNSLCRMADSAAVADGGSYAVRAKECFSKHSRIYRYAYRLVLSSLLLFVAAASDSFAAEGEVFRISGVQIEGNRNIDPAAIRAQLTKSSGEISRADINEDVRNIYNTGFFDQVTASIVSADGKNQLRFVVVEKPLVRKIYIRGNKEITETDLGDVIQLGGRKFVDRARVDALAQIIVSYYQSQGYYDVKVESSITPVGENQVDLTFDITEGQRYKIREVDFRGVSEIDETDLRSEVQTKRYKWWSSWLLGTGRLNLDALKNDQTVVRQFLLDHGYLDGSVGEPQIEKKDDGLVVIFDITEGARYKVGTISASGDFVDDSESKTLEGVKSETGEFFSAAQVREDSFAVSEKFTDVGYAFANVVPATDVNSKDHIVNLQFKISKGKLVRVSRINITGNDKTYDNVIRRQMQIGEEEVYSSSKVKRSQTLLQRLGYFDEVTVATEPTGDDDTVDLGVNVREANTGAFSAGVGYSSSDGALFNAKITEDNIFGTGRKVTFNVDLGTEATNFILGYSDDRFMDSYVSWGAEAYDTKREFQDFDRHLTGASTTFGYPLEQIFGESMQDISGSMKYDYTHIDITNVDPENAAPLVIESQGASSASGLTPKLVRNTLDNPTNPTSGSRQVVSFEYAGLGGSDKYTLFEARHIMFVPVIKLDTWDLIFSYRTWFAYGNSDDGDQFPLYRRFFPGGMGTVRGYKNRSLGPADAQGNEYGGSKMYINNFEMIFPLINSAGVRGLVFYDMGQAFDDDASIAWSQLRKGYGYGIRWQSPMGPLRLEFGYPIDRQTGESSVVTMFSFGSSL